MKNPNERHDNPYSIRKRAFFSKVVFCAIIFAAAVAVQLGADRQFEKDTPFALSASSANPLSDPSEMIKSTVDINSADIKELSALPGIGSKLAEAILKDRDANGSYSELKDLLRVKGIGQKTLEKVEPFLRFDSSKK